MDSSEQIPPADTIDNSMDGEAEACYRALLCRDRRFDGRFFAGVRSTGVYCRPICPARHPLFRNVRFFRTAAAAEEAGFRPCRRCRPETAPGTPAWAGTSATVTRALRLIRAGSCGEQGLSALSARLGIGERRLRQLFAAHLGASPHAVARVQRLDFARRLIDETSLPMAEIAFSSGFRSIRRFNDEVKKRFGKPPSLLRREWQRRGARETGDGTLVLHLPYRPPYAWDDLLSFLSARAIPGVEAVSDRTYARTVTLGAARGFLEVRPAAPEAHDACLELRLGLSATPDLMEAVERVSTLLDLSADPLGIAAHLSRDPLLAPAVAAAPGLRVPGGWDGFELAVRAVLGQQVSVQGASTLAGRLVRAHGVPISVPGHPELTHTFPAPSVLAVLTEADLSGIGVPRARAQALRLLAQRVCAGELLLTGSADVQHTVQALRAIPGIGPWTAQYIAMRVLRDPDAFPDTDLVLRRLAPESRDCWRPFSAYAAMYLWRSATKEIKR